MLSTVLIVLLVLLLVGALPLGASYNAGWGWGPGGVIAAVLVVLIVLMLIGKV